MRYFTNRRGGAKLWLMRRLAWFTVLSAYGLPVLAVQCTGSVARAAPPASTATTPAKRPALELSTEVRRCLRIGQLPRPDRDDAQLQCLASQDESGFVELVRSIAKRRYRNPGFGAERLEHLSWKVRQALSKGHQEAAIAVETMLDEEPSPDVELETTALEAMRWITIARRKAGVPKGHEKNAERPLVMAPRACAERVAATDPQVAYKAVTCLAEAEAGIPIERLIEAALKQPERVEIWRVLKRLRKLPEPHARRLAEALLVKRDNGDRRAVDLCETLLNTTTADATWATLAGRRAFDSFGVRECEKLARRSNETGPLRQNDPASARSPAHTRCLDVPKVRDDYVAVCADDLGPAVRDPARRGQLQVRNSRFSQNDWRQTPTTHPWLLEGERLLVNELSYVLLTEPPRNSEQWQEWDEGLVIVPSSSADGTRRRLHVFTRRNVHLNPVWQSPDCRQAGCRLDLVARRNVGNGALLGLLLLTERHVQPVALSDLLQGMLDERLGCPRLRPASLNDCTSLGSR